MKNSFLDISYGYHYFPTSSLVFRLASLVLLKDNLSHMFSSCSITQTTRDQTAIDYSNNSTRMALAPPPPLQIPAHPIFPFVRLSTPNSVTTILAPLPPKGCPN